MFHETIKKENSLQLDPKQPLSFFSELIMNQNPFFALFDLLKLNEELLRRC